MTDNQKRALRYVRTFLLASLGVYMVVGFELQNYLVALWVPVLLTVLVLGYLATPLGKRWLPEVHDGLREIVALATRKNKPPA